MANDFSGVMTSLITLPATSATVTEVGDLVYWDASGNTAEPFSAQADNVGEEGNQAEAAFNYLGVCAVPSNDGDTTVGVDTGLPRQVRNYTVPSGTYRALTLLGPSEAASGTALEDQQLEAVTSLDLATHIVWDDDSAARTVLKAAPIKTYAGPSHRRQDQTNTEALAADKVLTHDDVKFQILDPDGAGRNVDLPAEEESEGLVFVIKNTADAAEDLTVRDDAAATVVTVSQNEAAIVFSDGTNWFGLVGGNT